VIDILDLAEDECGIGLCHETDHDVRTVRVRFCGIRVGSVYARLAGARGRAPPGSKSETGTLSKPSPRANTLHSSVPSGAAQLGYPGSADG
jgi:hypothetical protein